MARGIDTAAHQAAVGSGTCAVLAGGVDVIYPAENAATCPRHLRSTGLLLSEQPMGLSPQARHFPKPATGSSPAWPHRRWWLWKAAAKSGSLITARMRWIYGREVLAVPGHPFDARAAGCNMLIRDGAQLVRAAPMMFWQPCPRWIIARWSRPRRPAPLPM